MYFWKHWRDNRARSTVYLILVASFIAVVILMLEKSLQDLGLLAKTREFWPLWSVVLGGCLILVISMALSFGAAGIGEEFAQNTAEFLLTRPRSRRHFVWAGWVAGAAQLLLIVSACIGVTLLILLYRTGTPFAWRSLIPVVPLFVLGTLVYSLTYLLTATLRSSRNGYASGLGIVLFYPGLVWLFESQWGIHLPWPGDVFIPVSLVAEGTQAAVSGLAYPVAAAAAWTLVALACPLAAQFVVERMEV